MNSFRCQQMLRDNKFLATVALVVALGGATSAVAQQAVVAPVPSAAPVAQAGGQATLQDMMAVGANQQVPIVKEKGLPAGATIGDAEERNKALAAESARKLDELTGDALSDKRENNDAQTLAQRQRQLMDVEYKLKLAKLSKELWKTLNGEDSEKEGQIKELEAKIADLNAQNEALKTRSAQLAASVPGGGAADPDPVVASVTGAGGSIEAKILVPYVGEVFAHKGDTLPGGQKIVSISQSGVTVSKDGATRVLAFGSSVPKIRPVRNVVPASSVVFPQ